MKGTIVSIVVTAGLETTARQAKGVAAFAAPRSPSGP